VVHSSTTYCCTNAGETDCEYTTALKLYSINPPNAPVELRELAITNNSFNFIYLPDHPGFYCAFAGGRFVQFYGEDGSEFQSTNIVPAGNKSWQYPFDDGRPYLVTIDSNTVAIYKPEIITDADGGEDTPLPTTLSLGKPYPNPFNATQTIPITTRPGRQLTVDVYNLLGQKVDRIYSGISHSRQFNITWKADEFASGIYLIEAVTGNESSIVKSILLK
jgi:hypothetical protein